MIYTMKNENYLRLKRQIGSLLPNQIISFVFAILYTLLQTYLVITTQKLIDTVISGKHPGSILKKFIIGLLMSFVLNFISQYFFRILSALGKNKVIEVLYEKLMKKEINFFINKDTGNLVSLIMNDAEAVAGWMSMGWLIRLIQLCTFIVSVVVMFKYSTLITIIILLIIFFCFISVNTIAKKWLKLRRRSLK